MSDVPPTYSPNERDLLLATLDLPTAERDAYLERACQGDRKLKVRIEHLLAKLECTDSFMSVPAIDLSETRSLPEIDVGAQIDRYKLMEQLGEGGMGVVFVAEQTAPVRRKVALKVIKPGMDSRAVIARFEAERQALAMMDHPNIARVLDAGTTKDRLPYFVMELVRGLPITKYCDKGRLSIDERLRLFSDICNAVQHAHQKGIIHRDLKPSNILVTQHDGSPVVKVIDFGVAKALHQQLTEHTIYTALNQVMGTPLYMSPEQLEFSGLDIDTRSDIYSLGVLLYELLTGTTPFDRDRLLKSGFDEMRRIIREEEPQRPSARVTTMPKVERSTVAERRSLDQSALRKFIETELDWIVLKALEKKRDRRYETASAFREDIERYLSNEPVHACPPSRRYRLSKWYSKHRLLVNATIVVLLSMLGGLIATAAQAERARQAEQLAESRLENERLARITAVQQQVRATEEKARADEAAELAKAESERAHAESEVAKSISDFLQRDLLSQIDVSNQLLTGETPDPDLKLATLLGRASQRMEGRFHHLPAVEGSLHFTLAECYRSLGKYDSAMKHAARAAELGRDIVGESHLGTLRAISLQGAIARLQGDMETAEILLLEALRGIENVGQDSSPVLRSVLGELLVLRYEQGKYAEAKTLAERQLELSRTELGEESQEALTAMSNLAIQHAALGDLETARSLHENAYSLRREKLGSLHPDTLNSLRNLAILAEQDGDYSRAQAMFKEVVQGLTKLYGADHPETLFAKVNLGHVLLRQAMVDEAEALLLESVEKLESILGKSHRGTLSAWSRLAELHQKRRQFQEALELRKVVLEESNAKLGASHPDAISARASYAEALGLCNLVEESQAEMKKAVELARNVLGEQHNTTLTVMNNLAVSYFGTGDFAKALEIFREVERFRTIKQGPNSLDVQTVRINIASVLRKTGEWHAAQDLLRQTITVLDETVGHDHATSLFAKEQLADELGSEHATDPQLRESEALYRQLIEAYIETKGLDALPTAVAIRRLMKNLARQGRLDDLKVFCNQQVLTARQLWGNRDRRTITLALGVCSTLQAPDHGIEAEAVLRELLVSVEDLGEDDPVRLTIVSSLVKLLSDLKRHDEALEIVEEAIARLPGDQAEGTGAMKQLEALRENVKTAAEGNTLPKQ